MHRAGRSRWIRVLVLAGTCLLPTAAAAHPGSGIVVDSLGQIYFVDMVSGVWKLDAQGALTHMPGPAFHWMTLDAGGRFGAVQLPSGSGWEISRIGVNPTLLLASDFPIAMGRDGNLFYPSHGGESPLQILKSLPSGRTSILASLPATTAGRPLRDVNGLAAGSDGSLYYTENDAIRRISREGRVSTVVENIALPGCRSIPGRGAKDHPLLRGLDVDAGGTLYVAATGCGSVLKITPTGHVTILPQVPGAWAPTGVALLGSDLYVLEFQHAESDDRRAMLPRVRKIAADGKTAILATVTRQ
jgi:DNA-binding beta-propeller fold protein YncE